MEASQEQVLLRWHGKESLSMTRRHVSLFLVLLLAFLTKTNAKESRELSKVQTLATVSTDGKVQYGPKTQYPDEKLFQDPAAFCEGCYGFITEVSKLLKKWSTAAGPLEDRIDTAFVTVCTNDRLNSYVLSPPKMVKLCMGILAHYEEEAALAILQQHSKQKTPTQAQLQKAVCEGAIPACRGGRKPMSVAREEDRKKPTHDERTKSTGNKAGEL